MERPKLRLGIATPERLVLTAEVDEVVLPGAEGYLGVLPGHAPLLTTLDVGEISYRIGDERKYVAVSGGFAEVLRESVEVLAETAEQAEEIDVGRAQLAKQRAEEELNARLSELEFASAEVSLKKALSRIQVQSRIG